MARIAGLPEDLLARADAVLTKLEAQSQTRESVLSTTEVRETQQLSLFTDDASSSEVIKRLESVDVMNLTPIQAMTVLYELKNYCKANIRC